MSFVQRLRMANMFPINSDLGGAEIDTSGPDPMNKVIQAGQGLHEQARQEMLRDNNMARVASMVRGKPLPGSGDFGELFNRPTNFRTENANATPLPPLDPGIRPGSENNIVNRDASGENDIDKNLARATKVAAIENSTKRTDIASQNAGNKGWDTITVVDPQDPTKRVSIRHNSITGESKALDIPGVVTRTPSSTEMNKEIADKEMKSTKEQAVQEKAQSSLDLLGELLGPNDELTDEAAQAVGKSMIGNWIPTTKGYSGSAKIKRLASERLLDLLGELKAQSKTGATGFGQMNIKELGVLEKAASMLDTGLDEETFKAQLKEIRGKLTKILMNSNTAVNKNTTDVNNQANAPQAPDGYEYVRRPDNKGWTAVKKVGG